MSEQSLKQDFINSIKGAEVLSITGTVNLDALIINSERGKVNAASNIVPAEGCDIVVHGASTCVSRFIEFNPDAVSDHLSPFRTADGALRIRVSIYCLPQNEDAALAVVRNELKLAAIEERNRLQVILQRWNREIAGY